MSKMNAEKKLVSRKLSSIAFLGVVICSATAVAQAGDLKFQSEMEALHQAARQWLAQVGLPPAQVAEMVFDAIRQETFYILTHPTTKYGVQLRMEDILQERMPTDIFQPAKPPSQ